MSHSGPYLTVQQWIETKPWPPLGGLRHLIWNSKHNGFDSVIRRVGRRILLDSAAFEKYLSENGGQGPATLTADTKSATSVRSSAKRPTPMKSGGRHD
jgi:hypothetical protein